MWRQIKAYFKETPTKLSVARLLLELGLSVSEDGSIKCGPVEVPASSIARVLEIDRRTVVETVKMILRNPVLKETYGKLRPAGPMINEVAKLFGLGVIVVHVKDPSAVGLVAKVTSIIAEHGISIRQIFAEDPELYPEPKLTIIAEKQFPGEVIDKILKVQGVEKVTVY